MKQKLKVVFLNYTGLDAHVGCLGVSSAQLNALLSRGCEICKYSSSELKVYWKGDRYKSLQYIETQSIAKALESCNAVVINGEGTMHHNRGMHLLSLAEFSLKIGKPVFLINATIDCIDGFDDVFSSLTDLAVREKLSYDYLNSKGIQSRLTVDSIVNADFNQTASLNLSGRVVLNDWHPHVESTNIPIINDLKENTKDRLFYYPLHTVQAISDWNNTVANFSTSSIVIAPRYHSLYLCGLGKTPFVALISNSHKVQGIIKSSGLPIPICTDPKSLESKINFSLNNPLIFSDLNDFLIAHKNMDFIGFDKYFAVTNYNCVNGNVEINSSILSNNYISISKKTEMYDKYYRVLLEKDLWVSKSRIKEKNQFIKIGNYHKYWKSYAILYHRDFTSIYHLALSAYGIRDFASSIELFKELLFHNKKVAKKYLIYLYQDLGDKDNLEKLIEEDSKIWDTARYTHSLYANQRYDAWLELRYRPESLKLRDEGAHYLCNTNTKRLIVLMEGGIGDQVRESLVFNLLNQSFEKINIVCDDRLIDVFKRTHPEFTYFNSLIDVDDDYPISPVQDLFYDFDPVYGESFKCLKANKILISYWLSKLSSFGKERVIGVCKGSHIHTPERTANIFSDKSFSVIVDSFPNYLFVNIGVEDIDIDGVLNPKIDRVKNFESLIAVIECCEVIITAPCSILDICGGMEKKVFAISTGYKFSYRWDINFYDIFHSNTEWIALTDIDRKTKLMHICKNKLLNYFNT